MKPSRAAVASMVGAIAILGIGLTQFAHENPTSTFSLREAGVSFDLPSGWGEPKIVQEREGCASRSTDPSCKQISYGTRSTRDAGSLAFLTATGSRYVSDGSGRGPFVGDESAKIHNEEDITRLCDEAGAACQLIRNRAGLLVARIETSANLFIDGELKTPRDETLWYLAPNGFGVVLYSSRLRYDGGHDDAVAFLDRVAASIRPTSF